MRTRKRMKKERIRKTKNESNPVEALATAIHKNKSEGAIRFQNKQRVLLFCSQGANPRIRHLMKDLLSLLPHSKKEVKFDKDTPLPYINELCVMKSCNNCIYFEMKKKGRLLYVGISFSKWSLSKILSH